MKVGCVALTWALHAQLTLFYKGLMHFKVYSSPGSTEMNCWSQALLQYERLGNTTATTSPGSCQAYPWPCGLENIAQLPLQQINVDPDDCSGNIVTISALNLSNPDGEYFASWLRSSLSWRCAQVVSASQSRPGPVLCARRLSQCLRHQPLGQ